MINFIILFILIIQIFAFYKVIKYIANIEREMKSQDKINILVGKRIDVLSEQLDTLFEMIKLESKRLDVYDKDDDADWWKNK